MILSDGEIREALAKGEIVLDPPPADTDYTTSAVDLHLGEQLFELLTPEDLAQGEPPGVERPIVVDVRQIDIRQLSQRYTREVRKEPDGSFLLHPRQFVLGNTRERVELPKESRIAARVEGRSTLARLGLVVHMTAPTIHADFRNIVLEIYHFGPYTVRIWPGLAFCQLIFERLGRVPEGPARTAFQDQRTVRE